MDREEDRRMTGEMRLYCMCGGMMNFDLSALRYARGMGTIARVPTVMFLVEHPNGRLLFETGLDPAASVDPVEHYGRYGEECDIEMRPEQAVVQQLETLSLTPADIDYVAMSCLYFDHSGGLKYLAEKSTIIVQREEVQEAKRPTRARLGIVGEAYCQKDLEFLDSANLLFPETDNYDVFGDGTVNLIRVPCHARGEQALMIRLPVHGTMIMPGGVLSQTFNVEMDDFTEGVLPGRLMVSPDEAVRSVTRLKTLIERESATVFVHHDLGAWNQWKQAPDYYD